MTITLAAVYAPIGFLGGLTGSLFREFAFTLAGSVIVSGVIALTLSPMMCSIFLKSAEEGRFARIVNRVFGAMTRWYGRRLDRSLDYRPITGLFALTILGLVGFLYMHTSKELAPEEDQGIVFAVTKAPKYANIDYLDFYGEKLDKVFQKFPETDLRFVLNGINGPQGGIAGMLLTPWDERKRSSIKLKPLVQAELSKIEGVNAFAFNLPPLPGGPGGLPVQMVINSTAGFQAVYEQMAKLKDAARKSGLFIVSDSDLDFNQPVVRIKIDRSKASDLGLTMQQIGSTLATLLGGNYVNRFNLEGRSYQVIPQVPRDMRLSPESLGGYYITSATGQQVPLSTVVSIQTATDPNALTHYNQLNSATFSAVPMPGVTVGQAVDFLEGEAKKMPAGFSHDYLADSRQYVQEGNQLAITFGFALIIIFLVLAAQFESLRDPLGDHDQRADGDRRRADPAVLRHGDHEHLHPGRTADAGRADQQARHPDGRIRQRAAAQGRARPPLGHRDGGAGPAASDPDDDRGDGHRPVAAADGDGRRRRQPLLDRACGRRRHVDRHAVHAVRAAGGLCRDRDRSPGQRRIGARQGNRGVRPRAAAQADVIVSHEAAVAHRGCRLRAAHARFEHDRPKRAMDQPAGLCLKMTRDFHPATTGSFRPCSSIPAALWPIPATRSSACASTAWCRWPTALRRSRNISRRRAGR